MVVPENLKLKKEMDKLEEVLETVGRLADKANNFFHATQLPGLPPEIHIEGLAGGMKDIRDELRKVYVEVSGEDPREDGI